MQRYQTAEPFADKALAQLGQPAFWLSLMVALYSAFFLAFNLASHAAFDTSVYDLGIYDQVVWNTAHGRVMAYTAEPWYSNNFLGTHLQPILILLAPIYWMWSDPRALIVLQSLAIGASAFLVYFLASNRLGKPFVALAVTFAYLMYPALQAVTRFDFHPESFEPFLFLSAYALYEIWRGRIRVARLPSRRAAALFFVTIVLALMVKEDVALVIAAFGAYLLAVRRERWLGPVLVAIAVLWFAAGMLLVMPHFRAGAGSPFLSYYSYLGETPVEILHALVTEPQVAFAALLSPANGDMLLSLLLPFGLLPLLSPGVLMIALPTLVAYGLSSSPFMHRMEAFHYAAPIIPWVVLAAIHGLGHWYDRRGLFSAFATRAPWVAVTVLIVASLTYQGARGYTPLSRYFHWPQVTEHERTGKELMRRIPSDAALVAQDRLYPHLSQRESISFLWPNDAWAEYILLDVSDPTMTNSDGLSEWLRDQVIEQAEYGVETSEDGFLLLKRGLTQHDLSDDFFRFARISSPSIPHPLSARTAEGIRFLGYDVVTKRYENALYNLYFTTAEPLAENYFIGLHLLAEDGATISKTRFQQPSLVWYPTSRWKPGEIVKVVVNTVGWSEEPERFGLAVSVAATNGVADGLEDPDPLQARLKWLPGAGEPDSRLLQEQTLLWLGAFGR